MSSTARSFSLESVVFEVFLFDERVQTSEDLEEQESNDEPQETEGFAEETSLLPVGGPNGSPDEEQLNNEDNQSERQSDPIAPQELSDVLLTQIQVLLQKLHHRIHRSNNCDQRSIAVARGLRYRRTIL